jgi:hypothetical protein
MNRELRIARPPRTPARHRRTCGAVRPHLALVAALLHGCADAGGGDAAAGTTAASTGDATSGGGPLSATDATATGETTSGPGTAASTAGTASTTSSSTSGATGSGGDPFAGLASWRLGASDFTIAAEETYYGCFELTVANAQLAHVVGFRPLVDNAAYVHHFVVMKGAPRGLPAGAPCFDLSGEILWSWAPGQGEYALPPEAGFLVGDEADGETTFILQVHYNNPLLAAGLRDSSGVELFYTPELRPNDAGSIVFADVGGISIPARDPAYVHVADCSEAETRELLSGEITVFGSFLHAHNIGSVLWAEQWRDGALLREINRDEPFDFGSQLYKSVGPFDVRPGDRLETHCIYDASDRDARTLGGVGSDDEMCWHEVIYYPRQNARADYCGTL